MYNYNRLPYFYLYQPQDVVMSNVDIWQNTMNTAYEKWQAAGDISYESFVSNLTEAERTAVLLGNLNYQVCNGGFRQWIDNGYVVAGKSVVDVLCVINTTLTLDLADRIIKLLKLANVGVFDDIDDTEDKFLNDLDDWYYSHHDEWLAIFSDFVVSMTSANKE